MQLKEAAEWAQHFRVLEVSMDELLAQLLNVPISQIATWSRPGRFLSGPEFAAGRIFLAQMVDLFPGRLTTAIRTSARPS